MPSSGVEAVFACALGSALLGLWWVLAFPPGADAQPPALGPVGASRLRVTEGTVEPGQGGGFSIDGPRLRAVVPGARDHVELRFTCLGPSQDERPLRSGRMRRQVGVKLRAQNGCNVIYAMWRLAPTSELVVQVKRNPGQNAYAECENRGYRNVRPRRSAPLPRLADGEPHRLRADLEGDELRVSADGRLVWEGALGPDAMELDGPVGVRTDNARFRFDLLVPR